VGYSPCTSSSFPSVAPQHDDCSPLRTSASGAAARTWLFGGQPGIERRGELESPLRSVAARLAGLGRATRHEDDLCDLRRTPQPQRSSRCNAQAGCGDDVHPLPPGKWQPPAPGGELRAQWFSKQSSWRSVRHSETMKISAPRLVALSTEAKAGGELVLLVLRSEGSLLRRVASPAWQSSRASPPYP